MRYKLQTFTPVHSFRPPLFSSFYVPHCPSVPLSLSWQTHHQSNAVQNLFQGLGFGLPAATLPPGWRTFIWEEVDVDELEGTHFIVKFSCPRPHGRLFNDVDDVSLLSETRSRGGEKKNHMNDEEAEEGAALLSGDESSPAASASPCHRDWG